ncbi:protein phosphatase 2C domain-containing protein [Bacillus sp. DTU_2020_1000418_1_SI_GHA_SEK_038]|uniref:PP2C family protein-serine/threonine phosphatase n=1 Tax=Bacillus sp. DTU_2020_1000418_1_SI_GHA_SEK_038 TaxID=3077585 RepID=UPI0028E33B2D|nr:protein phosphatase 2C domain-containing protein [Bacillus sp. DTU_2020_1000418_1_SI_GHA_SEK_038]WNS77453.1 protein phosphatase 2C domain-containing protein [Bacillus sp. DTU_2020_1000418_1_SI_GHA_SEK_038]
MIILVLGVYFPFRSCTSMKRQITLKSDPITKIPLPFTVVPGNAQHIGSRTEQQDAFAFSDIHDHPFINKFGVLAVLADGMGGLIGGKEASNLAVQTFTNHYITSFEMDSIPEKLIFAVKEANEAVKAFAVENGVEGGMGTTLIATVIFKDQLYWLSVGDSRIYLHRNDTVKQLTTDHIYAKELDEKVAAGLISREEAKYDPQRESLTSFLGLDVIEELDVSVDPIPLEKGDSVILCSDGLYGSVSNEEMIDICRSFSTQEAAENFIEYVLKKQKPHQDNATVAILNLR